MISRLLEDLGLFTGLKKQHDDEALFFIHLNEWLLRQAGGAWDHPGAFKYLLQHREVRSMAAEYLRYIMSTPRVTSFLGWKGYLRHRSPQNVDFPWGWKDPRNTFTLPLWLDIFPAARVIHIYRNGIDVADSLMVREGKTFMKRRPLAHHSLKRLMYVFRPKRGGFADSLRCASLEGGFALWEEYLVEARRHVLDLGNRAMAIRYEDFLSNPHDTLRILVDFCGLPTGNDSIERAAAQVRTSRAYAYKNKPELQDFSRKFASRLQLYGY